MLLKNSGYKIKKKFSLKTNWEPSDLKTAFSRYTKIIFWQLKTLAFHIFSQQDVDIFLDTTMVSFVGRIHNTRKTKERCQEIQGDGHAQCSYMLIDWGIKSQIGKIGIFWNVFCTYICRVKKNVQWGVLQFVLFVVIGRYFWYGIRAQGYRYHPRRMEYWFIFSRFV